MAQWSFPLLAGIDLAFKGHALTGLFRCGSGMVQRGSGEHDKRAPRSQAEVSTFLSTALRPRRHSYILHRPSHERNPAVRVKVAGVFMLSSRSLHLS
jgi:hypothetical protein